jgi:hypothetical protein
MGQSLVLERTWAFMPFMRNGSSIIANLCANEFDILARKGTSRQ